MVTVIAETYTIEALIGRGGMGAVFMASHRRLPGKKVAIKFLHADLAGEEVLRRFEREAQIASKLGHPNIVSVTDYNLMADGTPYLVLEYLEGASLAQHLASGPLPLDRVMSIVRQVGSALAAAHREGIVHRDLKPQNIFLVPQEVENRVVDVAKVLDFGISKIRGSQTVKTQEASLLGTPQYMAPEQATGQHDKVDERTDIFALGAIVHEMLTGQPAFSGANIPEVVFKVVYEQPADLATLAPATPPAVLAAVKRAMEKKADDRFATIADFVEALTGQPLAVVRPSASIPPGDGGPSSRGGSRSTPGSSGSRNAPHSTGREAFDATVGSGDHANALAATSAPPAAAKSAPPDAAKSAPPDAAKSAPPDAPTAASAAGAPVAPTAASTAGAPVAPTAASVSGAPVEKTPAVAPVRGSAPTLDSGNHAPALAAAGAAAAPARAKKPFAFVWVLGTIILIGGAGVFALTRSSGDKPATGAKAPRPEREAVAAVPVEVAKQDTKVETPAERSKVDTKVETPAKNAAAKADKQTTKAADTKAADTKAADTKAADTKAADTKAADTKHADTKHADTKTDPKRDTTNPASDETGTAGEDATFSDKLRDAQAALDGQDYAKAERLANAVINGDHSGPIQQAKAHVIHGIVACVAHNNLGDANADARALGSYPKLRTRLASRCDSAGIQLTP